MMYFSMILAVPFLLMLSFFSASVSGFQVTSAMSVRSLKAQRANSVATFAIAPRTTIGWHGLQCDCPACSGHGITCTCGDCATQKHKLDCDCASCAPHSPACVCSDCQ